MIKSINPSTGEVLASFAYNSDAEVDAALAAAATAQNLWRKLPVRERVDLLRRIALVLRAKKTTYAALITAEMGKPIVEAEAEIEKCAYNCDFYAEHAADYLSDETVPSNATESIVAFDPLGVVLAIMPFIRSGSSFDLRLPLWPLAMGPSLNTRAMFRNVLWRSRM